MNSSAGVRVETGGAHMCDMCSRTFAEPEPLALHYRRVHAGGERPFECKVCSKSFTSTRSLVAHRRVHTREKSYRCSHCDGKFVRSSTLQRHLLVHTGERPHRCTDCGKSFIQSFQLVLHMRSHTGEKPYVCSVCCKGFASAQRLKVHSRTHSRERPFACDFCDEAFTYRQGLKLHLMVHFGSRRLYASKKAFEDLIANGLSETPKKSTLFQQEDSSAAVVSSSFTPNSSSTTNPYDVGDDMTNRIEKCLNSSPPQELNGVSKSLSVGKISLRSDLFLPYDPRNHPRYTNNEKNHRQLSVSMLFGCSATVNQTNTDCRAKQLESNSNLQRSQELKQIQGCLNNKNYSKAKHYDFDSIQFRHIPPLIPIDSDSRHFLDGQS